MSAAHAKPRGDGPAAGALVLAATPMGQYGDASPRLRAALASAHIVAAEDTRRTRALAAGLGVVITGRIVSYYDQVEAVRTPGLVEAIENGHTVLVVTDAGMPSVSDPGFRLVAACADAGLPITCLPGPSAVTTALAVSGLPCERFCFDGFAPRKPGARITVVLAPGAAQVPEIDDLVGRVRTLAGGGMRLKDACAQIAEETGASKRELYEAAHDA